MLRLVNLGSLSRHAYAARCFRIHASGLPQAAESAWFFPRRPAQGRAWKSSVWRAASFAGIRCELRLAHRIGRLAGKPGSAMLNTCSSARARDYLAFRAGPADDCRAVPFGAKPPDGVLGAGRVVDSRSHVCLAES